MFATVFSGLVAFAISGSFRVAAVAALGGLVFDCILEALAQVGRSKRRGK